MADTFVTNPGAGGATFASDDISGVHYPRAKQVWGVDGVAVDTSLANPLPSNIQKIGNTDITLGAKPSAASIPVVLATDAPLGVSSVNPATITAGQVAVTSTAAALPAFAYTNGIVITASVNNTARIYVGAVGVTTGTGYPLEAGQSIAYGIVNGSAIYLVSAAAQSAAYTGN
jgi:hypothetical protein